ncbi:MAG: hypothetical protein KAT05_10135 [Spirochaetes bacterium]|nr:hypothetical protein [Spirochaetota bacterium]
MKGNNKTTLMNDVLNNIWNNTSNELTVEYELPEWNEETQHWHISYMRYMSVFVKTLDGTKIPIKWAFVKIFGQFGIDSKYLHAHQIEEIFQSFGLETGSIGRGDV